MRHICGSVDALIVWRTIQKDLPEIEASISDILKEYDAR